MMFMTSKEMKRSIVIKEIHDIYNLNIYPVMEKGVEWEFKKLSGYPKAKRSGISYQSLVKTFNQKVEVGFNVKTEDKDRHDELNKLFGVKFGDQEEMLYLDNIKVNECLCEAASVSKCADCPRQFVAEDSIDKHWLQKKIENEEESARKAKYKEKSDQEVSKVNIYIYLWKSQPQCS